MAARLLKRTYKFNLLCTISESMYYTVHIIECRRLMGGL
jgi:hypothetical protein